MNKKLTYSIILVLFLLCIAAFISTFIKDAQYKTVLNDATESYKKGAITEAWTKVKDYSEGVLLLEDGCELLISTAIQSDHLTEAKDYSQKCMKLKKGNGIAQEAMAMILVKESKIDDAFNMLQSESQQIKNSRMYSVLARVALLKNDLATARQAYQSAIELGNPWSPYLDQAVKSKALESKEFLLSLYKLVLTKPDIAAPVERKLMALLWKNDLLEEGNSLQKRLGKDAIPPVEDTQPAPSKSAGKLKNPNSKALPPGHPQL